MEPNKNGLLKRVTVIIALSGVMAALVAVATFIIQIYVPATGGYINFGDIMIFVSALMFGPLVGGIAGGVGSALSDVLSGYAFTYAPFTLVIKGFEGAIAGSISNRKQVWRDILAVTIAGVEMVGGYFLAEFFPLHIGWAALTEVPGNIAQITVGGAIGIPLALVLRRRLPEAWRK
ncbi:MAG TPA: ECF transporter S component [Candidatus Nanoarchaeia archaeon]|nr:ECF transporter S component [Candidatus Nanoarchaeia archaeon]